MFTDVAIFRFDRERNRRIERKLSVLNSFISVLIYEKLLRLDPKSEVKNRHFDFSRVRVRKWCEIWIFPFLGIFFFWVGSGFLLS